MRVVFVGRNRPVAKRVLLYILTFGISRRVWLVRINKEIDGHEALGLRHGLNAFLAILPIIGPTILTAQTSSRISYMLQNSPIKYGPRYGIYLLTWIPILGNAFFIGWGQSRLNQYWKHAKNDPSRGVDLDAGLEEDEQFRIEIGKALKHSAYAQSRFDQRAARAKARLAKRQRAYAQIKDEREMLRRMGGSTPMLPWKRPSRPRPMQLHITCGRCEHAFDVQRDPLLETPILCPNCGLNEVLPSLANDTPEAVSPVAVPTLKADCPKCDKQFYAVRNLQGPTPLKCPHCSHEGTVPAPKAAKPKTGQASASAQ